MIWKCTRAFYGNISIYTYENSPGNLAIIQEDFFTHNLDPMKKKRMKKMIECNSKLKFDY